MDLKPILILFNSSFFFLLSACVGSPENTDPPGQAEPFWESSNYVEYDSTTLSYTAKVNGPSEESWKYEIAGDDAQFFSINNESGILQFIRGPDFYKPSDKNRDSTYDLVIHAYGSQGSLTSQRLKVFHSKPAKGRIIGSVEFGLLFPPINSNIALEHDAEIDILVHVKFPDPTTEPNRKVLLNDLEMTKLNGHEHIYTIKHFVTAGKNELTFHTNGQDRTLSFNNIKNITPTESNSTSQKCNTFLPHPSLQHMTNSASYSIDLLNSKLYFIDGFYSSGQALCQLDFSNQTATQIRELGQTSFTQALHATPDHQELYFFRHNQQLEKINTITRKSLKTGPRSLNISVFPSTRFDFKNNTFYISEGETISKFDVDFEKTTELFSLENDTIRIFDFDIDKRNNIGYFSTDAGDFYQFNYLSNASKLLIPADENKSLYSIIKDPHSNSLFLTNSISNTLSRYDLTDFLSTPLIQADSVGPELSQLSKFKLDQSGLILFTYDLSLNSIVAINTLTGDSAVMLTTAPLTVNN